MPRKIYNVQGRQFLRVQRRDAFFGRATTRLARRFGRYIEDEVKVKPTRVARRVMADVANKERTKWINDLHAELKTHLKKTIQKRVPRVTKKRTFADYRTGKARAYLGVLTNYQIGYQRFKGARNVYPRGFRTRGKTYPHAWQVSKKGSGGRPKTPAKDFLVFEREGKARYPIVIKGFFVDEEAEKLRPKKLSADVSAYTQRRWDFYMKNEKLFRKRAARNLINTFR